MRLKLTLAYDGSSYAGWQIQAVDKPTIQGAVEAALFQLLGQGIRAHGAGRTDAGVHAYGQVCHCDVPNQDWHWARRLNAVLPGDIRIVAAEQAPPDFHARRDAISKTYVYDFWQETGFVPPFLRKYVWACGELDVDGIRSGLDMLSGEHDFASFQNSGTEIRSTRRTIFSAELSQLEDLAYFGGARPGLRLTISGSGFLKQMVRNIAGFLVWIGKGKCSWEQFGLILGQKSRKALPSPTAPAMGLALAHIAYPDSA